MSARPASILVIDDEPQIRRLLRLTLESAGYVVRDADRGQAGLAEIGTHPPDAVILDLGLPDVAGMEVLRRLREWSRVPVLVLTVRSEEAEKVAALDAGADDYLTKPFGAEELGARLRALLRRAWADPVPGRVTFGEIEFDPAARLVRRAGAEIQLTAREYDLLRLLVLNRGRVLTHQHILRELWGPKSESNSQYLRVHMTHLRQKLETDPHRPRHLKTESGIGFRLVTD